MFKGSEDLECVNSSCSIRDDPVSCKLSNTTRECHCKQNYLGNGTHCKGTYLSYDNIQILNVALLSIILIRINTPFNETNYDFCLVKTFAVSTNHISVFRLELTHLVKHGVRELKTLCQSTFSKKEISLSRNIQIVNLIAFQN